MGFVDAMRAEGHAVESICRILREQGCQVAARTYRDWKTRSPAPRTVTDAQLVDVIRDVCWCRDPDGVLRLTPEGLYGRRKLTAYLRRTGRADAAECTVARAMRTLGHQGVRRARRHRTTIRAKDGVRAADLLNRDFTAAAPNQKWVADFTYCRTWSGFVYVAFVVDCFAQRIVAWHASTSKATELVMTPLRMALWQRDRDGHPVVPGRLVQHSDAGSQPKFNPWSQHRCLLAG
jgi:putative transposase